MPEDQEPETPRIVDNRGKRKEAPAAEVPVTSGLTEEQQALLAEQLQQSAAADVKQYKALILLVVNDDGSFGIVTDVESISHALDGNVQVSRTATSSDLLNAGASLNAFVVSTDSANRLMMLMDQRAQQMIAQQQAQHAAGAISGNGVPANVDPRIAAAARGKGG